MNDRKQKGDRGEAAVSGALARRGYTLLERQYRCRWGEIDIIARSPEDIVCFVEVKTRSGKTFAQAREYVTAAKQQKLRTAAACYLAEKDLDCPCRFDVAEVYGKDPPLSIHYIINAF